MDLDLRGAPVRDVLRMLAEVTGRTAEIDPCVQGAVDIRLVNTPASLVLDALAAKFGLVHEEHDRVLAVACVPADDGGRGALLAARVSLDEREALLPEVLERLAASARLAGVDYRAGARPRVSVRLERVRVATALAAIADSTGLDLRVVGDRLTVDE